MADKSTPLILDALTRAFAEPAGLPLHGPKRGKGLFAASASAKEAAQRCLEEGYLRVLHREVHGKSSREFCALTEKGLAFVSTHVSPKQVLEELTRTLQGRQAQVAELVETARQWQAGLEALRTTIETVLQQMPHRAAAFAGVAGPAPSSNGSAHVPA